MTHLDVFEKDMCGGRSLPPLGSVFSVVIAASEREAAPHRPLWRSSSLITKATSRLDHRSDHASCLGPHVWDTIEPGPTPGICNMTPVD